MWYHSIRTKGAFFDAHLMNNLWDYNPFPENGIYEMHQSIEPLLKEEIKTSNYFNILEMVRESNDTN